MSTNEFMTKKFKPRGISTRAHENNEHCEDRINDRTPRSIQVPHLCQLLSSFSALHFPRSVSLFSHRSIPICFALRETVHPRRVFPLTHRCLVFSPVPSSSGRSCISLRGSNSRPLSWALSIYFSLFGAVDRVTSNVNQSVLALRLLPFSIPLSFASSPAKVRLRGAREEAVLPPADYLSAVFANRTKRSRQHRRRSSRQNLIPSQVPFHGTKQQRTRTFARETGSRLTHPRARPSRGRIHVPVYCQNSDSGEEYMRECVCVCAHALRKTSSRRRFDSERARVLRPSLDC